MRMEWKYTMKLISAHPATNALVVRVKRCAQPVRTKMPLVRRCAKSAPRVRIAQMVRSTLKPAQLLDIVRRVLHLRTNSHANKAHFKTRQVRRVAKFACRDITVLFVDLLIQMEFVKRDFTAPKGHTKRIRLMVKLATSVGPDSTAKKLLLNQRSVQKEHLVVGWVLLPVLTAHRVDLEVIVRPKPMTVN